MRWTYLRDNAVERALRKLPYTNRAQREIERPRDERPVPGKEERCPLSAQEVRRERAQDHVHARNLVHQRKGGRAHERKEHEVGGGGEERIDERRERDRHHACKAERLELFPAVGGW